METYDDLAAYKAVITTIRLKVPDRAPQAWLAEQLGVSRQIAYRWEHEGIPPKHADKIASLLGMAPAQVCPSLVISYLPGSIFEQIVEMSTPKKPFHVRLVELLRIGLAHK